MRRTGFSGADSPGYLLPGTDIVVDGWQARDGSTRANGSNITLPDGKKLFVGSSGTGAPFEKDPAGK